MIFENYLTSLIHENFDDRLKLYGFKYVKKNNTQRNISFYFLQKELLVVIKYNYPNHFIDINLYRETDLTKLIGAENISLIHILKDKKYDFLYSDYLDAMPDKIPIEKCMKILSEWLVKYGGSYLDGSEWKTNRDIKL